MPAQRRYQPLTFVQGCKTLSYTFTAVKITVISLQCVCTNVSLCPTAAAAKIILMSFPITSFLITF